MVGRQIREVREVRAVLGQETQLTTSHLLETGVNKESSSYTTSDRLRAEAELLGSLPSHVGSGIVKGAQDAWANKTRAATELGVGLVIGSVFTLVSKNPHRIAQAATTWLTRGFVAAAAVDLGSRFYEPMNKVWKDPGDLDASKTLLGNKVGDAVFNYGLGIAGGIAGARMTEKFIAPTKLGTWLQGYSEKTVTAAELSEMMTRPQAGDLNVPQSPVARAFATQMSAAHPHKPLESLPELTGKTFKLRQLQDGSQVASVADGSVLMITRDGTGYWFQSKPGLLGFNRKLELSRILHSDGTHTEMVNVSHAGLKPNSVAGRDPSEFFDAPASKGPSAAAAPEGFDVTSGVKGNVRSIETSAGRFYETNSGEWIFRPTLENGSMPEARIPIVRPPTYNLKLMTDWLFGYKKGTQAGFGSRVLDATSEIGSGIIQHEALNRIPGNRAGATGEAKTPDAPSNKVDSVELYPAPPDRGR